MFFDGDESTVDFDGLANGLFDQGCAVSPAEVHGCLSGILAAGAERSGEVALVWLQRCLALDPVGELAGTIIALYEHTALALDSEDMAFAPLLPDEGFEVELRITALGDWSRGFVAAYAQYLALRPVSERDLRPDTAELLNDMVAIAQAIAGDDDDEDALEDQLYEVVEYLRVAAMNIYLDTAVEPIDSDGMPSNSDSVH